MKFFKGFAIFFALVLLIAAVAGFLMGSEWEVKRQTVVPAPIDQVADYTTTIPNWQKWTVWNSENYPEMKIVNAGPEQGPGAIQRWDDGAMVGELKVTSWNAPNKMDYNVNMDNGAFVMDCSLEFAAASAGTEVTWRCWGDTGLNPFNRLMTAAYEPIIGKDFQGGLDKLATLF